MEGDVAAAVAFEKLDAALGKEFGRGYDVCGFRVAAERDDGRVFQQEKDVADLLFFAQSDQLLLQAQAGGVVDGAELDERNQIQTVSPRRHRDTEKSYFLIFSVSL